MVVSIIIIVFLFDIITVNGTNASINTTVISKLLNNLVDDETYDKRLRPNYGGKPVTVGISVHVLSVSDVSEIRMEFTVDLYLRQHWHDPRLNFSNHHINDLEYISLGKDYLKDIWVPDTFFPNGKRSMFHEVPSPNSFLRNFKNGNVLLSQRCTITASCPMTFKLFPMDSQKCSLEIESYGHTTKDILYNMTKEVGREVFLLPQYMLTKIDSSERSAHTSTGDYHRVIYTFHLSREMGFYIIQIYLPCIFVVVISWMNFWISSDLVEGRIGLGVVTVLTITTLMLQTNASLPKVSYIKSIEIYLAVCFLAVFSSLIECALVAFLTKSSHAHGNKIAGVEEIPDKATSLKQPKHNPAKTIDVISRILFPLCFLIFNIVYWTVYLNLN